MGDRDQFLVLLLRNEADLRAFIGALVLDGHVRDDVFQDCALMLWKKFEEYDAQRSFGAWARGMAANMVMKRRHDDQRFPVVFSPETVQAVLEAFDRTEHTATMRSDALSECVKELPDHARELLVERYERERKPAEIAAATGRTLDAIYQALSRIRGKLEDCIRSKLNETETAAADGGV